jgi:hypothetical protein
LEAVGKKENPVPRKYETIDNICSNHSGIGL